MFIIKRESNEYVKDGVYCSCDVIYFLGIKLYAKVFTTTNTNIIQQFQEPEEPEHERQYSDPVVVTGFQNK